MRGLRGLARSRYVAVARVVVNPWPAEPDAVARSNRDTIVRVGQLQVCTLGAVARPHAALLAAAGAALGVDRLIG
jgi:hypothetical protein